MRNYWALLILVTTVYLIPEWGRAQTPQEILKRSEGKMRGNTMSGVMTIKTVRPTWSREMSMKMWAKGDDYSMIYVLTPEKDKGTTFLKRNKEVWNWLPSLERTIKLPPSMMSQSWMGTDFTNDDLVKESSFVTDFTQTILNDSTIQGRVCYKIQLIPKPEAAVVWGKIIVFIDKKDFLQMRSEFYDEDGTLVNIMSSTEIKNLGGRMLPSVFEMIPADKPGNKTMIIYQSLTFDQPIADDFFTTQNMKQVK
jgi:outer membrane lipoprotein-sorting protein